MNHSRPPLPGHGTMEDYTKPFLVAAGVLCFVGLVVIWAIMGFFSSLAAATSADWWIRRRTGQ